MESSGIYRKFLKPAVVGVVAVVLIFIGYRIYLSSHFRVVNTNPNTRSVATISPFLKINFNRQLSGKNLSVTSSYSVISSYKVEGKTLVINLKVPMASGYEYYIKVNYVSDMAGDVMRDKTFRFTPKKISSKNLPEDQRQALLNIQSHRPRSKNSIVFTGTNSLINVGVSYSQINSLGQYFFNFSPEANTVSISNVVPVPHNRNSSSTLDTINFNVKVDAKSYQARINYSNLTSSVRLLLSNSSGAPVFDSASVASEGD